ncbi:MAG TPA: hypothetical protein VF979_11685 [Streptosporangiaceae bacterium]
MTHKPTIEWVCETLGGVKVGVNNHTNLRTGSTSWGKSKFRPQYKTLVSGSRAQLLCGLMLPYMHTKAEQARLVSIFPVDERRAPGRRLSNEVRAERERLGAQISALNRW